MSEPGAPDASSSFAHSTAMFGMEEAQAARSSADSSTTVPPAAVNFSRLSAARPMATSAT